MTLLEVCVDSEAAAELASEVAQRLEYCSRLDLGGLTPDPGELRQVVENSGVLVHAMIRPRGGNFVHDDLELTCMERSIDSALDAGAHGLVMGVLDREGCIDVPAMRRLIKRSRGVPVTFHRAFDEIDSPLPALEVLVDLGVKRLLTTGGPPTAWEGREQLARLVQAARDRLVVMPGGGVRLDHVHQLIAATGAREVHSSVALDLQANSSRDEESS
jgi:copper homeostasis protein